MGIKQSALRELALWQHYPQDRLRWLWGRCSPLRHKTFRLGNREYRYFLHPYNHTWANERAVEIPVARSFLGTTAPSSTLEIGNVLSHYGETEHTVVDKVERCRFRRVLNQDLLEYEPQQKFECVVAISTIEHIGWEISRYGHSARDEGAVIRALDKLRALLRPGGRALVTVPMGYNLFLDQQLPDLVGDRLSARFMKRVSGANEWVEVNLREALACKYGKPHRNANAVGFLGLGGVDHDSVGTTLNGHGPQD